MTDLTETSEYSAGIYQIETTDPVLGGPPNLGNKEGIANVQAQQLAKRTKWLKAQVDALNQLLSGGVDQYVTDTEFNTAIGNFVTQAAIDAAINNLVNGAPAALDTLKELADALDNNDDAVAALTAQLAGKLNTSTYTAADILAKLKTVDSSGSGLDADLLDGLSSSSFVRTIRTITAGTGLAGGGSLASNRTISVDFAEQTDAEGGTNTTEVMNPLRTKQAFQAFQSNAMPTAWVNFNGLGTVAIREAFNISSITDLGAGRYRANFANPMANTNYAVLGLAAQTNAASDERSHVYIDGQATTYLQFYTTNVHGTPGDWDTVSILIMGGE